MDTAVDARAETVKYGDKNDGRDGKDGRKESIHQMETLQLRENTELELTVNRTAIFDTHAHYNDARFDEDREVLLASLAASGVAEVCEIGYDAESSARALALAERYPWMCAAVGIHPEEAGRRGAEDIDRLRSLALSSLKVRAIGEIGLDYYWPEPERSVQQQCFRACLALAGELDLPVVIHSRDAAQDSYELLAEAAAQTRARYGRPLGGVVHCFSYSAEMALRFAELGFYIGIGGVLTFKNARKLREAAQALPLERIVLETDCPYMAPEPHRGQRNDSALLVHVADKLAELKAVSRAEVLAQTSVNAARLYRLPLE